GVVPPPLRRTHLRSPQAPRALVRSRSRQPPGMTSRRPARCAACSRGFRTGEKISVEDASVYHRSCLKWQMENGRLSLVPINPLVDEMRARVADLEGQLARAQEWHQREKRLQ